MQAYDQNRMVIRRGNSEEVLRNKLLTNQASLTEHIPNEIVEVNESKESSKRSASTLEQHRDYLKNNRGKTSLDGPIGGIDMTQAQNRIEFGTLEDYSHGLDTNEFLEKMQRNMKRNDGAEVDRGDLENEEIEGVNRTASRILTDKLNLYMTEQSFGTENPRPSQDKKNMFYNGSPGQSEYQTGGTMTNKLSLKANHKVGKGKHLRDTFGDIAIQSQGKPKDFEQELRRNEKELNQQLEKYKEMMDEEDVRHRSVSRSGKGPIRDKSKSKGGRKGKGKVKDKGKGKKHRYKHHSEMESVLHEGNQMGEILMDQKGRIRKDTLGSSNKNEVKTAKKGESVTMSKPEGNQNLAEEKAESVKSDLFDEKEVLPKDMMISNKIVTQGALKHDVSETTRITSESGANTEIKTEDNNFTSINQKTDNAEEKLDIIDSKTENKPRTSSKKGVEMTLEFEKGGNVGKKRDKMLKKLENNRKRMIKSRSKKKFNGSPGFKRNNNKFGTSKSRNISRNNNKNTSRNVSKSFNKSPNRNLSKNRNLTKPKPKNKNMSRNMSRNMNRNSSNRNKSRTLSRNMSKKYMSTKGRPSPASLKKNLMKNHNSVNRRDKPGYKTNGSKVSRGPRNSTGISKQFNKTGESKRFEDDEDSKQVSGVEWTEKTHEGDEDNQIYKRYQANEGDEPEGTVDIEGTVDNEGTIEIEVTTEVERRQDNEGTQELEKEGGYDETQEIQEEQENDETQEIEENEDTQETIRVHEPHSNQREPRKDSEPMEWIEEQESMEFQDQDQTGSRRFKTMDVSPEHQQEMIRHGPKISEGSNIRSKFDETRARFKEKGKLQNDFTPGELERRSNRSVKKLIPHSKSPMRGKSPGGSRKLNLPKYMTKKNSKFNRTTGKHMRGPNNYLKMNYIIKNVLLVGGWNNKRRQVYLEMVKANKKCHMVVVFKNKNGHDCLGRFIFL